MDGSVRRAERRVHLKTLKLARRSPGQLVGLMGGMSGAAELEKLTDLKGKATLFMLSQSFAHVIVIAFIIIGNVAYFRGGRKSKLKGE